MNTHPWLRRFVDYDKAHTEEQVIARAILDYVIQRETTLPYHSHKAMGLKEPVFLLNRFIVSLEAMSKINFPIHTIPFLVFKLKTFRKAGFFLIFKKYFINMLRSIGFMTWYVGSIPL